MAGHSKWANIKHKKAATDARRGKMFTKIIRELVVAARGGASPDDNPTLRTAVDKALGANMKKDTIEKAIARGAGGGGGDDYQPVRYEGYAPGGIAVLVECMTDNHKRTVAEVRHLFTRHGGSLGTDGSVAYLFQHLGQIWFAPGADEERIMEVALEHGAEDIDSDADGALLVTTPFAAFVAVRDALRAAGLAPEHAETAQVPTQPQPLDADATERVTRLAEALDDLDDVQAVYTTLAPDA